MVAVLEEYTTEENRSVVHFLCANRFNTKDIHKEMFPVYDWKSLSHKVVHSWFKKTLKDVLKSQMMPDQIALFRLREATVQQVQELI
jgi:hypothetical protein